MIHQLDLIATIPLKGRDSHGEQTKKRPKTQMQIETPTLPFDTQPIKIRRTVLPPRPSTAISSHQKKEGSYSKKFSDSTWASNEIVTRDKSPTRDDVKALDFKFEKNIEMVSGYQGVELAQRLQAVNDMLLDELVSQFRVLNLGQGKLLEKSRNVYAQIFQILDDDAEKSSRKILELKQVAIKAEEDKKKAITDCQIRISQVESQCKEKVNEAQEKLEAKMNEFDENMKEFLEQKTQLEKHVKALHHVFLDFQSDSVYLTLEELKNQLNTANLRAEKKEQLNFQLQSAINKWKAQYQELSDSKKEVEEACNELRQQLQLAQDKNEQLQRQIVFLKADLEACKENYSDSDSDSEKEKVLSELKNYSSPMVNQQPEAVQSSPNSPSKADKFSTPVRKSKPRRSKSGYSSKFGNSTPFIGVHQKLCKISSVLSQFIENSTGNSMMSSDRKSDEDEMQLLQGDLVKTERIIEEKVDKVIMVADLLNQIDGKNSGFVSNLRSNESRFFSFFSRGISTPFPPHLVEEPNIYCTIRKIMQAKYYQDKWNQRSNRSLMRLPEFVVCFFYKDDKRIGTSLHLCKKLWEQIQNTESVEIRLFHDFLIEKLTLDELTFFLEMRNGLIGLPLVQTSDQPNILVQYKKCTELMDRVLGAFSPVASLIADDAQKYVKDGKIDYAVFLDLFLKFYSGEREKRKEAVKLMVQSKKFSSDGEMPIVLEIFISIVQSLGFQGSFEQIMEFYRESRIISGKGGDISLDGFLKAMDEMNIHFYSIDVPFDNDMSFETTEASRQMIRSHWSKFSQWFEGLRRSTTTLDTWVRSQLIIQVRHVDQTFQTNLSPSTLFGEMRNLLDLLQFVLNLIARGSSIPMKFDSSEKQLILLEDLNELLLKFIISAGNLELQAARKK